MDSFKNVSVYKKEPIDGSPLNYLFFCDEKGRDWYEIRNNWKAALAVNSNNLVCAFEEDVTLMTMVEGQTVYEVIPEAVPSNVIGHYLFSDGEFLSIEKNYSQEQKNKLIQEACIKLSVLEAINETGELTSDEVRALKSWKLYLVNLYRTNVTSSSDINWPEKPNE